MERERNANRANFDPRKRATLKVIGQTLALGAVIAFSGRLAYEGLKARKRYEDRFLGQPIEGEGVKKYVTNTFGNGLEIPLRPEPTMKKEVAIALEGFLVNAQPVYGVGYPSNEPTEGEFFKKDGKVYGRWYQVEEIPFFVKNESGEYIPGGVARGVYVAGNFLTRAEPESDN